MPDFKTEPVLEWLKRVITQPRSELDRWQRMVRFGYDLSWVGARQLREDRALQMAGALAYFTLFGLLPVTVVATVLARALMGPSELKAFVETAVQRITEELGVAEAMISNPVAGTEDSIQTLGTFLLELIGPVLNVSLGALGWGGVIIVILSAIGLMVTIEKSFNIITRAPEGRPWLWRVTIYWTVLTVSPAAIAGTLYLDAWFAGWTADPAWQWVLTATNVLWSFAAVSLFLTLVYKLVPNTTVSLRPAVAGAFVAALLLEVGKRTLGAYLDTIAVSLLSRSLGLIPLFMLWIYLMWLVVLFGLEVTATLQRLATGRDLHKEKEQQVESTHLVEPASVLTVMEVIAERFAKSSSTSASYIATATSIPPRTVQRMLDALVRGGFLHWLHGEEGAVTLARPPERIDAAELIETGFRMADGGIGRRSALLDRLRDAQRAMATSATLAELLTAPPRSATDQVAPSG